MQTSRIAKKEHVCLYCVRPISPGDEYIERKERWPRFDYLDENDPEWFVQVGVYYRTERYHVRHSFIYLSDDLEQAHTEEMRC